MAKNVISQVLGGSKKVLDDVYTVADVRRSLGLGNNYPRLDRRLPRRRQRLRAGR